MKLQHGGLALLCAVIVGVTGSKRPTLAASPEECEETQQDRTAVWICKRVTPRAGPPWLWAVVNPGLSKPSLAANLDSLATAVERDDVGEWLSRGTPRQVAVADSRLGADR